MQCKNKCPKKLVSHAPMKFAYISVGIVKVPVIKKTTSCFPSDFESVFAYHLTGKILSFDFYPKAVYFECKFWISRSTITFKADRLYLRRLDPGKSDVRGSLA